MVSSNRSGARDNWLVPFTLDTNGREDKGDHIGLRYKQKKRRRSDVDRFRDATSCGKREGPTGTTEIETETRRRDEVTLEREHAYKNHMPFMPRPLVRALEILCLSTGSGLLLLPPDHTVDASDLASSS
jgi:hypothetical protein